MNLCNSRSKQRFATEIESSTLSSAALSASVISAFELSRCHFCARPSLPVIPWVLRFSTLRRSSVSPAATVWRLYRHLI